MVSGGVGSGVAGAAETLFRCRGRGGSAEAEAAGALLIEVEGGDGRFGLSKVKGRDVGVDDDDCISRGAIVVEFV